MAHASDLIEKDILAYLKQHENKEILRFITCGSVDDGKSTLIGRLLHDSKMIFEDQLAAIEQDSKKVGTQGDEVDLALLVDGLQSEREQGITIDVAYRYFSTDKRKFIIADTPGHEQYTRNMATGASTCDLAVILVDAANGVQTQTKRHSFICSLFGIKHLVVAINKMDLVDYSEEVFEKIKADYREMAAAIDVPDIHFVPISALKGDNVVNKSEQLSWYTGKTLMDYLETVAISTHASDDFRLPVQLVCRPNSDFRGFQGTIASGSISVGDAITVVPANTKSSVKSIVTFDGDLETATAGQAVTITLNDEIDVSRGDMLAKSDSLPNVASRLRGKMIWMHDDAMQMNKEYVVKFASKSVFGKVDTLHYRIDVNSFDELSADTLTLNEIGKVDITLSEPVAFDSYTDNRQTGSFIIIDRMTNLTVGAGMVQKGLLKSSKASAPAVGGELGELSDFEKELILLVRKHFPKS